MIEYSSWKVYIELLMAWKFLAVNDISSCTGRIQSLWWLKLMGRCKKPKIISISDLCCDQHFLVCCEDSRFNWIFWCYKKWNAELYRCGGKSGYLSIRYGFSMFFICIILHSQRSFKINIWGILIKYFYSALFPLRNAFFVQIYDARLFIFPDTSERLYDA